MRQMVELRKGCGSSNPDLRYWNGEDLVLQHGTVYIPKLLPNTHRLPSDPKSCFRNACCAAIRSRKWLYVEGYALNGDVPLSINHAWLAKPDEPGAAFDPTWNTTNAIYLGIAFRLEYVRKIYRQSNRNPKNRSFGVIEASESGFPLLYGRDALEDVIEGELPVNP
jgi:hypothetical protein